MTVQDKHSKANSRRYRAAHGGIQTNRAKNYAAANPTTNETEKDFPKLPSTTTTTPGSSDDLEQEVVESEDEQRTNFSRRKLDTNLDRYHEPEPEPDAEPEPETDLSGFLKKQLESLNAPLPMTKGVDDDDDDDIDHAFSHLLLKPQHKTRDLRQLSAKETSELAEMDDVRKKADASRELRARFTGRDIHGQTTEVKRSIVTRSKYKVEPKTSISGEKETRATELVGPLDDEAFLDELLGDSSGTYGNIRRK